MKRINLFFLTSTAACQRHLAMNQRGSVHTLILWGVQLCKKKKTNRKYSWRHSWHENSLREPRAFLTVRPGHAWDHNSYSYSYISYYNQSNIDLGIIVYLWHAYTLPAFNSECNCQCLLKNVKFDKVGCNDNIGFHVLWGFHMLI